MLAGLTEGEYANLVMSVGTHKRVRHLIPNSIVRDLPTAAWPRLSRPCTRDVDARHKTEHDESVFGRVGISPIRVAELLKKAGAQNDLQPIATVLGLAETTIPKRFLSLLNLAPEKGWFHGAAGRPT